jgi:hypothetical protein
MAKSRASRALLVGPAPRLVAAWRKISVKRTTGTAPEATPSSRSYSRRPRRSRFVPRPAVQRNASPKAPGSRRRRSIAYSKPIRGPAAFGVTRRRRSIVICWFEMSGGSPPWPPSLSKSQRRHRRRVLKQLGSRPRGLYAKNQVDQPSAEGAGATLRSGPIGARSRSGASTAARGSPTETSYWLTLKRKSSGTRRRRNLD